MSYLGKEGISFVASYDLAFPLSFSPASGPMLP